MFCGKYLAIPGGAAAMGSDPPLSRRSQNIVLVRLRLYVAPSTRRFLEARVDHDPRMARVGQNLVEMSLT